MVDPQLCRRVEEASLNAWPALQQMLLDGWVLRFSRGFTKRANSIVPLYLALQMPIDKVRYCENLYAREQLKTIFRLTTVVANDPLDVLLEGRGYQRVDPTLVLGCDLANADFTIQPGFRQLPRADWLDAYARNAQMPDHTQQLHAALLQGIRTDHTFGAIDAEGGFSACGMAVLERELVGLFDIVTNPAMRRRGHARLLVQSLLKWAQQNGARHAYLQVMQTNHAARELYRELGFVDLYHYWYRVAP
jgi:ribosomal protein S18 acetylase RimI-like enzyme